MAPNPWGGGGIKGEGGATGKGGKGYTISCLFYFSEYSASIKHIKTNKKHIFKLFNLGIGVSFQYNRIS